MITIWIGAGVLASAGSGSVANGVTLSVNASLIAGVASGAALVNGQTLSASTSLIAGSASGGAGSVDGNASGVVLTAAASVIGGFAGGVVGSLHGRKPRSRGRVIVFPEQIAAQAAEVNAAFHAVEVSQNDAQQLEEATRALRSAILESDFNRAFIVSTADALVRAAHHAAQIEDARNRAEQVAIAAAIAAQIEEEIRDEEESVLLLLA